MAKEKKTEEVTPVTTAVAATDTAVVKAESMSLESLGDIQGTMERPKSLSTDRDGTEDITQDEIQLPRLAIAQGLSPQCVPGEAQFIKGLSIGEMFNDVSEEIYGNGPLMLVPCFRHVTRIEFDPENLKVPLDREVPANDPRMKWHGNEPPRATEYVEFVSMLLRPGKAPEPLVVSIKTTNKPMRMAAKLWTTYIATRNAPIYSGLYRISTKIEKGMTADGKPTSYGVFILKNAGFIPKDTPAGLALYEHAKAFHESMIGKTIVTEREAGDDSFDTSAMEAEAQAAEM